VTTQPSTVTSAAFLTGLTVLGMGALGVRN
jgi:hypothetical protein